MPIGMERRGPVQVLIIDRPDALNAFSPDLIDELVAALDAAGADPQVRAVVLTGAGRAFSAGADISEFESVRKDKAAAKKYAEVSLPSTAGVVLLSPAGIAVPFCPCSKVCLPGVPWSCSSTISSTPPPGSPLSMT